MPSLFPFNLCKIHFLLRNEEIKTLKSLMPDASLRFELLSLAAEQQLGCSILQMLSETFMHPATSLPTGCLASVRADLMAQQKEKL